MKKINYLYIVKKIVTFSFIFFLASCGGGGGGGGSPTGPATPVAGFLPDGSKLINGSVTLQENSSNGDIVNIDIYINGNDGVSAAIIKLVYDPSLLNWDGTYQTGDFLENGGTPEYIAHLQGGEGTLSIAVSLVRGNTGVSSVEGVLITIPFKVLASGNATVEFTSDSSLLDSSKNKITDAASNPGFWSGGTVSGS